MSDPIDSSLAGRPASPAPQAPHNTPEKSDLPPPPPHPLPPPAAIAAHAARREPTADGWYSWTGKDLDHPPPPSGRREKSRTRKDRNPIPTGRSERGRTGEDQRGKTGEDLSHPAGWTERARTEEDRRGRTGEDQRGRTGEDLSHPAGWSGRGSTGGGAESMRDETQSEVPHGANTVQDSSRGVKRIMRRDKNAAAVRRAVVATRVATTVLCLVAFSVLAADRHKGWARDSYNNYSQFRYCETVNVVGFIYSCFQLYAIFHHNRNEKHLIRRPVGNYFDFIMDQVLAYLLISATSSAAARVRDWIVNWGSDAFPNMANGAIAVSFLAFLAFAFSSLLSAYNLFNISF